MTPSPRAGGAQTGDGPQVPPGVDTATPTPARLYDYFLGGTNNFAADRSQGERIRALVPEISDSAWANRAFHQRAARWMAADRGIRQFIDLGAGLPTQGNTHELVQQVRPDARVVYVDIDPMVLEHSRSLLAGTRGTRFIQADLRDPDSVLSHPDLRELIDFSEPVGLLMTGVMYFVADESDPWRIVARFASALPAGSYLALSHLTADSKPPRAVQEGQDVYARATEHLHFRTKAQVERFFDGLEIVPPYPGAGAVVSYVGEWGAEDPRLADGDDSRWLYCAVARRP
jgi:O-methyltransferase involved in polyketide biosynthesis